MIYLLISIVSILTIIFFVILKKRALAFQVLSSIFIISGLFLPIFGYLLYLVIKSRVTTINLSSLYPIIFQKFLINGIILIVIGLILFIISKILKKKNINT